MGLCHISRIGGEARHAVVFPATGNQPLDGTSQLPKVPTAPTAAGRHHKQPTKPQVLDEGMGDLDFSSIYRYVYGSGSETNTEWREGEQLWSNQAP